MSERRRMAISAQSANLPRTSKLRSAVAWRSASPATFRTRAGGRRVRARRAIGLERIAQFDRAAWAAAVWREVSLPPVQEEIADRIAAAGGRDNSFARRRAGPAAWRARLGAMTGATGATGAVSAAGVRAATATGVGAGVSEAKDGAGWRSLCSPTALTTMPSRADAERRAAAKSRGRRGRAGPMRRGPAPWRVHRSVFDARRGEHGVMAHSRHRFRQFVLSFCPPGSGTAAPSSRPRASALPSRGERFRCAFAAFGFGAFGDPAEATVTRVPTPGRSRGRGAVVQADQSAHQRQAEPGAFEAAIIAGLDLKERVAEPRQIIRPDADAGVSDGDRAPSGSTLALDRHPAVRRRELDRVRQQVDQDLPASALVGDDFELPGQRRATISTLPPGLSGACRSIRESRLRDPTARARSRICRPRSRDMSSTRLTTDSRCSAEE